MTTKALSPAPQAPELANASTVQHPVFMAGSRVFEVKAGVPVVEAMDALAVLLATAQAAAQCVATTAESIQENPGAPWATVHLLELAGELHASIHAGLAAASSGAVVAKV